VKKQIITVEPFGEVQVTTSPRSRSVRIKVVNRRLVATKPRGVPLSAVKNFIANNESWVAKKLNESTEATLIHDGDFVAPNTRVFFEKTENAVTSVVQRQGSVEVMMKHGAQFSDKEVQDALVIRLKTFWRKEAKKYIPSRLDLLAEQHGFRYNELRLKDIRTRWGSCSSKGNININIQLIKLDEELIDHVLLHELSHTKAMNHGQDFWDVFEDVRPGAKQERKQLKQMTIF
jgi:predicted metal-dependent hydrolase